MRDGGYKYSNQSFETYNEALPPHKKVITAAQSLIADDMHQRNLAITKSMLQEGCDLSFLAEGTNLSQETMKELKNCSLAKTSY